MVVVLAAVESSGRIRMSTLQSHGLIEDLPADAVFVPDVARLQVHDPDPYLLRRNCVIAWDNGPQTRAINLLRAQLRKRLDVKRTSRIGVTSAEPDAGKSFITVNLAFALARIEGQQVALFDFDLRRPTVARRLGIESDVGIENWLAGEVDDLATVGRRIGDSALSVYIATGQHPRATELIASARFNALVAGMAALPGSTIVLCDLPPAFVSDEAMIAIERLDGYIHVIDEGITPRRQAEELRAMMAPAVCIGAVLNRYNGRWNDSYGSYAARKYARYYDDPKS